MTRVKPFFVCTLAHTKMCDLRCLFQNEKVACARDASHAHFFAKKRAQATLKTFLASKIPRMQSVSRKKFRDFFTKFFSPSESENFRFLRKFSQKFSRKIAKIFLKDHKFFTKSQNAIFARKIIDPWSKIFDDFFENKNHVPLLQVLVTLTRLPTSNVFQCFKKTLQKFEMGYFFNFNNNLKHFF